MSPQEFLGDRKKALEESFFARQNEKLLDELRIQRERLGGALVPSSREYARQFGLNSARLRHAKEDCLVMHPGPINRGVEITPDVADGPHSVILHQVSNGIAVRMAVLWLIAGSPAAGQQANQESE